MLDDGSILVAGLTGKMARSTDSGKTWLLIDIDNKICLRRGAVP